MSAELRALLYDLVDDEPCHLDHDGGCQAHNWFNERECPHARAKRYLAQHFMALRDSPLTAEGEV